MVESLNLSKSQAGFIASANFAGYLAGAIVAATPRLPGSARFWLVAGLFASALTTAATAASGALVVLAAVRFLGGVASAFVLVFSSSVILGRLAGSGHGRLSSVHFAGVGAGIAVSAAIVSILARFGEDWQIQWLAVGLLSFLAVPIVARLVPDEPAAEGPAAAGEGEAPTVRLFLFAVAYGLFGFGYVITATFLVAIVRASPAIAHLEPVAFVLFGLSAIPSVALWAALGRRIGVFRAYAVASLVEALGVAASVLFDSVLGIALAAVLLGGTFMGLTSLGLVGARSLAHSNPRRVLALMTGAFGIGQIIGPLAAGALSDRTGSFTLPTLIAAGALVIGALLAGRLERNESIFR
jgi:predicted MFS family arabinose efflux permease